MMDSRKKSVYEYREWLKPYIAKFKAIRELSEGSGSNFVSDAYVTPGFGQSQAITGVRLWCWTPLKKPEKGKPSELRETTKGKSGFIIDPYDSVVKAYIPALGYKYKIEDFKNYHKDPKAKERVDKKVRDLIKGWVQRPGGTGQAYINRDKLDMRSDLDQNALYYVALDVHVFLSLVKTPPPGGFESDNIMFFPIQTMVFSQNIAVLFLLEVWCREKQMEKYIEEMIGARSLEVEEEERIEAMFNPKEEKKQRLPGVRGALHTTRTKLTAIAEGIFYTFVRRGPYEMVIYERIAKMYSRSAGAYFGAATGLLQAKMGIK